MIFQFVGIGVELVSNTAEGIGDPRRALCQFSKRGCLLTQELNMFIHSTGNKPILRKFHFVR